MIYPCNSKQPGEVNHHMRMLKQNTFLMSCEQYCCIFASLFPKLFVSGTMAWSLYVMLVIVPNYTESQFALYIQSSIAILLFTLCMIAYFRTIHTGPGSPLDYPQLKIDHFSENPFGDSRGLNGTTGPRPNQEPPEFMTVHTLKLGGNQGFRYCGKCNCWKPDRTHHCSKSGKCILKMDHYCPWFSICIGYFNYKFFVQFLYYTAAYCWIAFGITFKILYDIFATDKYQEDYISINLILLCVLSLTFGISLGLFAAFSLYMISKNTTTIEFQEQRWNYRGIDRYNYEFDANGKQKKLSNIFDLGKRRNFKEVFGDGWWTWLLPVSVTEKVANAGFRNGINFKINDEVYKKWCHNAELQNQLNEQLLSFKDRVRRERETYVEV